MTSISNPSTPDSPTDPDQEGDRKELLKSYFASWRPEILSGHFESMHLTIKNKPWLTKEHQEEIIQFVDSVLNELVGVNPYIANDFLLSFKGRIDELQLQMLFDAVENYIKKVHTGTTRIQGIPQKVRESANASLNMKKRFNSLAEIGKKISKKAVPIGSSLVILTIIFVFICFRGFFLQKSVSEPTKLPPSVETMPIPDKLPAATNPTPDSQMAKDIRASIPQSDSLKKEEPTTKEKARIMLVNASAMYQKGLAAKARKKLIEKEFPSQNILTKSHTDKVSRVYAYYCDSRYLPILKEALAALYPKKDKTFFDITPKERTVNGWILNAFRDENLHVLIRMPNDE
jgi:hypothetical protein